MPTPESIDSARQTVAEWQKFLDAAIHDVRAPLRAIGTSAELLRESCGELLDQDANGLITRILDGVAKIEALSKSLSAYSNSLQAGSSPAEFRLESALRSALTGLEAKIQESNASVTYDPLPRVRGSHEQLSFLFHSLLSNALLYRGVKAPAIHVTAWREGDEWRMAVRDNGMGIETQYRTQIFQPFQRLRGTGPQGVGLGLTICQKIIEAHGGRIWVESQPQAGSTFVFTLPADTAQVESAGSGGS